jgi:uncharacterized OB-fold protein
MVSPVKIWRNQKYVRELVGKTGIIESWTIVRVPPAGFSSLAPYAVALVKLENGNRAVCQMSDTDFPALKAGLPVRMIVRRVKEPDTDGIIAYGIKAIPLL